MISLCWTHLYKNPWVYNSMGRWVSDK